MKSTDYKYTVFKDRIERSDTVLRLRTEKATPKTKAPKRPAKEFCEFFAGIGLVREGLAASGWSCVYANDIDPKKQAAYEARFGEPHHFHLGDVWKGDEVVARIPGKPVLATASFPCIDLSLAGHYRGLGGEHSSTFFGFAKVLESLGKRRPPIVLVENVLGFLTSRRGEDFALAANRLAKLGYWLDVFVLDACHFTPQSRPRVFVIGMAEELKPQSTPSNGWLWSADQVSSFRPDPLLRIKQRLELATGWVSLALPDPPECYTPLANVLDTDDGQNWWEKGEVDRHYQMMSDLHRRQVDAILAARRTWVGTIFRRVRENQQRAEVRFDGLAGCLRTPKGGSAKQIVIAAQAGQLRMRWMTPREYARLQGVPDFPLVGTTIQQLWGFADAVCVPVIAWIDQHVLTPLYECVSQDGRTSFPAFTSKST